MNPSLDENAAGLAGQLYIAGTETTATALSWAILYSVLNPDTIKKAQKEIDEVIGMY